MTPPSSLDRRRNAFPVWLFAVGLMLLRFPPAVAGPGNASDADDVPLRLDLKTVAHTDDGSSITYRAETYEEFPDNVAAFKWTIDKNGDQRFDLIVFAEWDQDELVAGIDDAEEEPVAEATVTRPAANTIQVSFSAKVLGSVSSYQYSASADNDLNGNGETDAGEQDVAPDSGLYRHDLAASAAASPSSPTNASPTPPVAGTPAPAEPAPPAPPASEPDSSAAPDMSPGSPGSTARPGSGAGPWAALFGAALIVAGLVFMVRRFKSGPARQP